MHALCESAEVPFTVDVLLGNLGFVAWMADRSGRDERGIGGGAVGEGVCWRGYEDDGSGVDSCGFGLFIPKDSADF